MTFSIAIIFGLAIFAFGNNRALGGIENETGRSQVPAIKLGEDLSKFEAEINKFNIILNNLKEGNKRKWQGFISFNLLEDNLKEFRATKTKISLLKRTHRTYQDSINGVYDKFIKDHAKEIKQRKKAELLKGTRNLYSKRFLRDCLVISIINIKTHKELEDRTAYATELTGILKNNVDMKAIIALGKNILAIDSGNVPAIRNHLATLKGLSQQVAKMQNEFEGTLQELLDKK
ncbi:uncharacterized protein LOC116341325 [Contarinia nasturtii]|uniref:uncharacterized protein LOC116341325 n=1 Tax=Contarinia nasturtii TaxID=265458 RepID=UPI0012D39BAE|nr:uncharacterized protein LOC116341325 [Contarinia nasturtii]XP_031624164.1 uncharacterized protein LOC116341325 [Contarinia nasturtii]XP_031624165.1 uncharacterized protein LOC116341325 [Contarinia nasturtii]